MRIALIGAAGSGKTELANQIAKEKKLEVVDGYAEAFSKRTDLAIGFFGGYSTTLGIALDRIYEENKKKDDYVVCGTTLDSLLYVAMMSLKNPNQLEYIRAKTYLEAVAILFYDYWVYDHVFVCRMPKMDPPTDEEVKDADELIDNSELRDSLRFDGELDETLRSFANIKYTELPYEADRMKIVMETINADNDSPEAS